jgi:hypothetical protein
MDRLKWTNGQLNVPIEENIYEQNSISIYNGDEKTAFVNGKLQLTSHRLIWHDRNDHKCMIELSLFKILNIELKQVRNKYISNY